MMMMTMSSQVYLRGRHAKLLVLLLALGIMHHLMHWNPPPATPPLSISFI